MLMDGSLKPHEDIIRRIGLDEDEIMLRLESPMLFKERELRPCDWRKAVPLAMRQQWGELDLGARLRLIQVAEIHIRGLRGRCNARNPELGGDEACPDCKVLQNSNTENNSLTYTEIDHLMGDNSSISTEDMPLYENPLFLNFDLSHEDLIQTLDILPVMLAYLDNKLIYRFVNQHYREYLGLTSDQIDGQSLQSILGEHASWDASPYIAKALKGQAVEYTQHREKADGTHSEFHIQLIPMPMRSTQPAGFYCLMHDLDEQQFTRSYLSIAASQDRLTRLGNREALHRRLDQILKTESQDNLYVVIMDLDRFRNINDSLGYLAGDLVLGEVTKRLIHYFRHPENVFRLGNDEFVILLQEENLTPDAMTAHITAFMNELNLPIHVEGHQVKLNATFGMARKMLDTNSSELLKRADLAMKNAHHSGRPFAYYTREMHQEAIHRLKLEADLNDALRHEAIQPYFQPIVDLKNDRTVGFEALARWIRPDGSITPPNDFISLAESTGQIVCMGRQILRRSLRALTQINQAWESKGEPPYYLSVNVSPVQLSNSDFASYVEEQLTEFEFDPAMLLLEITEEVMANDERQQKDQIKRLKSMGIRLACDDFGTGYCSLGRLNEMPWDIIKIDRSFLANEDSTPLLTPITQMAKCMKVPMVVEGVEEAHQAEKLKALGCDYVQGYYYGRPCAQEQAFASPH